MTPAQVKEIADALCVSWPALKPQRVLWEEKLAELDYEAAAKAWARLHNEMRRTPHWADFRDVYAVVTRPVVVVEAKPMPDAIPKPELAARMGGLRDQLRRR